MLPSTDYTATLPTKRMGAGLLFNDHVGRVLPVALLASRACTKP